MKNIQQTILTIQRQLISAFALFDGWFDKEHELLSYVPASHTMSISDVMEYTMLCNDQLLEKIGQENLDHLDLIVTSDPDQASYLHDFDRLVPDVANLRNLIEEVTIGQRQPLPVVRRKLRDQLNECLYQLELLGAGEGLLHYAASTVNSVLKLDVYQYMYFVAKHTQSKANLLETIEKEYLEKFNKGTQLY